MDAFSKCLNKIIDTKSKAYWSRKLDEHTAWKSSQSAIEMNLEVVLVKINKVLLIKEKAEARRLTEWLRSIEDEKAKEIAYMLEMSAESFNNALEMKEGEQQHEEI